MSKSFKFIDIGVNLTDPMFRGIYHSKKYHEPDLKQVIERAWKFGMQKMIVTSGNLKETEESLSLCMEYDNLYCTVGVHPTRCCEFVPSESSPVPSSKEQIEGLSQSVEDEHAKQYLEKLMHIAKMGIHRGKIVAIGELGLDYDRLHFCSKEIQQKYFDYQFALSEETKLPLFLHQRNSTSDFMKILKKNVHRFTTGVVHCFTGSKEDLEQILAFEKKLYIGITPCSLKTQENLNVIKLIPSDRLMIETDAPWCDMRSTHASSKFVKTKLLDQVKKEKFELGKMVKSRNEPCSIVNVLEVIAACRNEDPHILGDEIYKNTMQVFFPNEKL